MSVTKDKKYDGNVFPLRFDWVRGGRLTQMYQTFNILSVKDTEGFQSSSLNGLRERFLFRSNTYCCSWTERQEMELLQRAVLPSSQTIPRSVIQLQGLIRCLVYRGKTKTKNQTQLQWKILINKIEIRIVSDVMPRKTEAVSVFSRHTCFVWIKHVRFLPTPCILGTVRSVEMVSPFKER